MENTKIKLKKRVRRKPTVKVAATMPKEAPVKANADISGDIPTPNADMVKENVDIAPDLTIEANADMVKESETFFVSGTDNNKPLKDMPTFKPDKPAEPSADTAKVKADIEFMSLCYEALGNLAAEATKIPQLNFTEKELSMLSRATGRILPNIPAKAEFTMVVSSVLFTKLMIFTAVMRTRKAARQVGIIATGADATVPTENNEVITGEQDVR